MNREGFKEWLLVKKKMKPRLVSDMLSRAKRAENAFIAIDPTFSFENEFVKDKGVSTIQMVSKFGKALDKRINLPIGSNQMGVIADAVKKYFQYLNHSI